MAGQLIINSVLLLHKAPNGAMTQGPRVSVRRGKPLCVPPQPHGPCSHPCAPPAESPMGPAHTLLCAPRAPQALLTSLCAPPQHGRG